MWALPGGLEVESPGVPTVGDLRREIVNARVRGGIHFRFSNKVGGALGDRVAAWALDRFFRPI